jgi:hypothetical protein
MTTKEIRQKIAIALPPGRVLAAHTEDKHFYEVTDIDPHPKYPSVTEKLACLKDPSLNNFKMNQALGYVRENFTRFTPTNIEEHMGYAARASSDIFEDAGDVGSKIHDVRERYFSDWISAGVRPEKSILEYIPSDLGIQDQRIVSASRAIDRFVSDYRYEPIATELKVYSHELKLGGTLDDIGFIRIISDKGDPKCEHDLMQKPNDLNEMRCSRCNYKARKTLALIDLKSSNQLKFYYAYQVSLYDIMFRKLTGINPEAYYILKVSKTDGSYYLQEIKNMRAIAKEAKNIVSIDNCNEMIKESFKKPSFKI